MNNQQVLFALVPKIKWAHFVNMVTSLTMIVVLQNNPFSVYFLDNPCKTSAIDCRNNGACVYSNTDPPVSSCRCREGFTGTYCETVIHNNPCSSNPCQTRGHCALSTTNKTYTCICREHFIGEYCERNNPCLSSPCLNQAMCQPHWNQTDTWFTCRCVGTYTGSRCETSLLNPCGGLCMNG